MLIDLICHKSFGTLYADKYDCSHETGGKGNQHRIKTRNFPHSFNSASTEFKKTYFFRQTQQQNTFQARNTTALTGFEYPYTHKHTQKNVMAVFVISV